MFKVQFRRWLFITCWLGLQMPLPSQAFDSNLTRLSEFSFYPLSPSPPLLSQSSSCPEDLETLISLLIRDLPSYANRVIQRSRRLDRTVDDFSYVIVAGRPEFDPLTLGPGEYIPAPATSDLESPQQVFLTTLERQYQGDKIIEFQNFHWLFLTETVSGWRLAMIFTRIGSAGGTRPPTPPRESSNGVIGQAVSTWLRDCRAGAIRG